VGGGGGPEWAMMLLKRGDNKPRETEGKSCGGAKP